MLDSYYKQSSMLFSSLKAALLLVTYLLIVGISLVEGQVSTPCTTSMISTFTPCMNYMTGSTSDGTKPASNCCEALKSVMSSSMDCACLLVTASVPLPQLVNRTLALGLPRVCQATGVPVKCEAISSPLPSPGPVQFGAPPTVQPPSSAFSPQVASKATASQTPASESTATGLTPMIAPSPVEDDSPSRSRRRRRPVLTPSASSASMILSSSTTLWALFLMGFFLFYKL